MSTVITDEQAKTAISENIVFQLEKLGRSKYWLMQEIGMTEGSFYPIARGEVVPSVAITARIAEALGVTVDSLLKSKNSAIQGTRKKIRKSA